jgi:hypothetical protein
MKNERKVWSAVLILTVISVLLLLFMLFYDKNQYLPYTLALIPFILLILGRGIRSSTSVKQKQMSNADLFILLLVSVWDTLLIVVYCFLFFIANIRPDINSNLFLFVVLYFLIPLLAGIIYRVVHFLCNKDK